MDRNKKEQRKRIDRRHASTRYSEFVELDGIRFNRDSEDFAHGQNLRDNPHPLSRTSDRGHSQYPRQEWRTYSRPKEK